MRIITRLSAVAAAVAMSIAALAVPAAAAKPAGAGDGDGNSQATCAATPNPVAAGAPVTVNATGLPADSTMQLSVYTSTVIYFPNQTAITDSAGNYSVTFNAPAGPDTATVYLRWYVKNRVKTYASCVSTIT